jgi:hypothetical protein
LITQEAFTKFLDDIQKHIEEADKALKERGNMALRMNFETYRQKVSERLTNELTSAEVYKSLYVQTTT